MCLSPSSGGDPLFSDDFTRADPPGPPAPVPFTWTVPTTSPTNGFKADTIGGTLNTSTTSSGLYGFAYPSVAVSMTDGSVEAKVKNPTGATGGVGIAGRLNTVTGQRYALWLYGGGNLRLIKFRNWGDWSPALAETNVGANDTWHTIKLSFSGSTITAYYDGVLQSGLTSTDASYASGGVDIDYWTGRHLRSLLQRFRGP